MSPHARMKKKEELPELIERWKERQGELQRGAEELHNRTDSYFVQIVTKAITRDAEKHAEILQSILDCFDCTVTVTPEELGELTSLLDDHLDIQKKTDKLARTALKSRPHYITSHLLRYILEDGKKNAVLVEQLNDVKGRLYPYG